MQDFNAEFNAGFQFRIIMQDLMQVSM